MEKNYDNFDYAYEILIEKGIPEEKGGRGSSKEEELFAEGKDRRRRTSSSQKI